MMRAAAVLLLLIACPFSIAYYTRDSVDRICSGDKSARVECGYPGILPRYCEARQHRVTGAKCCFDDTTDGAKWCFYSFASKPAEVKPSVVETPVTAAPTTRRTTTTTRRTTTTTRKPVTRKPFFRWPIYTRKPAPTTTTTPPTTTTTRRRVVFTPTPDLLGNTVPTGPIFEQPKTTARTMPSIFQFLTPVHQKPGDTITTTEAPATEEEGGRDNFANFLNSLGLEVDSIEVLTVKPGTGALGTNIAPSKKPPVDNQPSINVEGVDVTTAICSYFQQNDDIPEQIQEVFEDSLGDCASIEATVEPEVANEVLRQQIQEILNSHVSKQLPTAKVPTALDVLNKPGGLTNFIHSGSNNAEGFLNSISNTNRQVNTNPFASLLGGGNNNMGMMASMLGGGNPLGGSNLFSSMLGGGGTSNMLSSMLGGGGGTSSLLSSMLGGGGTSNMLSSMLGGGGGTNSLLSSMLGGGGTSNMLSSMLGGGGGTSSLLSSMLGGGGSSSSTMLLMNMLQNQMQQGTAAATQSPNVGVLQPNFIPTAAPKKPNQFLCNFYLSKMQGSSDSISQIMRITFFNSGCLQSILSNPLLLLQDGGLDRIKQILGLSQPVDEFYNAATGPLDMALVPGRILTECLQRRDEFSLNYNCKVGTNINIRTEQECTNVGCVYAPGNLCFRCPLIKTSAEANQLPQVTCSIAQGNRESCPGFERYYTITSILGRRATSSSPVGPASSSLRNPSQVGASVSGTAGGGISLSGRQGPAARQGLASLLAGMGGLTSSSGGLMSSSNPLQQMLIQQMLGNQGGGGLMDGGIMGYMGGYMGQGSTTSQSTLTTVLLKNKCTSMGCCWDASQVLYGISANACFKKAYPSTSVQSNNNNCYNSATCGKQTGTGILHRIIGGVAATTATDRPWQVMIKIKGAGVVRCSGVLICSEWVLTTASCLMKIPDPNSPLGYYVSREPGLLAAYVSTIDPADLTATPLVIEKIVPHPSYVVTQNVHDIALLKIAPVDFTANLQPVCLPAFATQAASANTFVFVAGYGSPGGTTPQSTLKEIKLKTISYADCQAVYKSSLPPGGVFCANPETATEDTCKGDGGSPALVFNSVTGQYTLVGINFGGSNKCTGGSPLVFTDIARYRYWITQTTNGCCPTTGSRTMG